MDIEDFALLLIPFLAAFWVRFLLSDLSILQESGVRSKQMLRLGIVQYSC